MMGLSARRCLPLRPVCGHDVGMLGVQRQIPIKRDPAPVPCRHGWRLDAENPGYGGRSAELLDQCGVRMFVHVRNVADGYINVKLTTKFTNLVIG